MPHASSTHVCTLTPVQSNISTSPLRLIFKIKHQSGFSMIMRRHTFNIKWLLNPCGHGKSVYSVWLYYRGFSVEGGEGEMSHVRMLYSLILAGATHAASHMILPPPSTLHPPPSSFLHTRAHTYTLCLVALDSS